MLCKNATMIVLRTTMTSSVVISEAALLAEDHGLQAGFKVTLLLINVPR